MVTRRLRTLAWSVLMAACLAALGCPPPVSPYKCIIAQPALSGTPRLIRQANAQCIPPVPSIAPLCGPLETRRLEDECESVDDLQAITGDGYVCGPGGEEMQQVCPRYADRVFEAKSLTNSTKPCGPAACPNRELVIQEESGSVTRVLFYDDIGCHSPPPHAQCSRAGHSCYYRVLSVTSILAGVK